MSFLTAEWRKLLFANYAINPDLLREHLPPHTELDLWQGKCYVSLVGFLFDNVKLLGIPIPFHRTFEEVNLRFYVRHKTVEGEWRRGVVFIKEIVPKSAITFVANTVYREHYETQRMRHVWDFEHETATVKYEWKTEGQWQTFAAEVENRLVLIEKGSEAEFITEHYFGYTKIGEGKSYEYEVRHPSWEQYPILSYTIEADFSMVYGEKWAFLNDMAPSSLQLAHGSAISVEKKRLLV